MRRKVMGKIYSTIFIFLFFSLGNVSAGFFDGWMDLYSCETAKAARSCKSGCRRFAEGIQIRFTVHPSTQVVVEEQRNAIGENVMFNLKGCTVVDEDNWSCRDYETIDILWFERALESPPYYEFVTEHEMADGSYYFYSKSYWPSRLSEGTVMEGHNSIYYQCAK